SPLHGPAAGHSRSASAQASCLGGSGSGSQGTASVARLVQDRSHAPAAARWAGLVAHSARPGDIADPHSGTALTSGPGSLGCKLGSGPPLGRVLRCAGAAGACPCLPLTAPLHRPGVLGLWGAVEYIPLPAD